MSQKKRVGSRYNGAMYRVKRLPHYVSWYCCNCCDGPYTYVLEEHCMSCGKRRCTFCRDEADPVPEIPIHNISPGNIAALHETSTHVLHNIAGRAATPSISTGSAISNTEFANSLALPYSPEEARFIDIGTSYRAQSEAPTQHSSQVTSQQQNVGRYGDDLVPSPTHGPYHDLPFSIGTPTPSHYHTAPHSPDHPQEHSPILNKPLITQVSSDLPPDYSVQYPGESSGYGANPEPENGAASSIAIDTPASDPGVGTIRTLLSGTAGAVALLKQTNFPTSTRAAQSPIGSDTRLIQPNPPLEVAKDDFAVSPPLQLDLPDHNSPKPPISDAKSPKTPKKGKTRKVASKNYECCKSSDGQRLACPFYKYDPQQHIGCISKAYDCIGRLGQHLKQSHKLGPDRLPKFSKMRVPADKKWYWGWKELFGEAAALPECPFSHPAEDLLKTQCRSPGHELPKLGYVEVDWPQGNGSPNHSNYADSQLSITPGRDLAGDINLLNITEGIAGLLPEYIDVASSYPDVTMSPFPESWSFDFEEGLRDYLPLEV
ncbi:hypothetical protein O1611_g3920 [Lasiodiplodia mahajangana]|uniref:Uncharacterized protein n=1 Tax=Lasiodiplodia mahajangana TaxID=1108764 RepID=A0ACC2JQF5_9PEZI|nr:hypothetical protein O1611_g3920 [Lasiodiplodia mahajangana]